MIKLIKLYKIWYANLDKALLFTRNHIICLKNWKLWQAPTTVKFSIFCWNFAHVSYLMMSTKGCSEFFFILFRSWVIIKNVKNECVKTRSFLFFTNVDSGQVIVYLVIDFFVWNLLRFMGQLFSNSELICVTYAFFVIWEQLFVCGSCIRALCKRISQSKSRLWQLSFSQNQV